MTYAVEVLTVPARPTAVVRCRARQQELAKVIPQACGEVWAFIRSPGQPSPGRNLALYLDCVMNLEVGVEVDRTFPDGERVVCSSTPAGPVATTAHFGPYDRLGGAHEAVHQWCAANGRVLAGPSWEIYGHWTDDATKLRTDVFYLLQPEKAPG